MSKEKQIKSTDWLTRGIPKEQIEREKQEAILSADLELCHTEFRDGVKFYTDYDATAKKMFNIGYRKQSENMVEVFCKVGDMVYQTDGIKIYELEVFDVSLRKGKPYYETESIDFDNTAIGKSIFLTKEEAEAKMKGGAE